MLHRKNIRLSPPNYRGETLLFATLCFHQRTPFARDPSIAKWLISILQRSASSKFFVIHAYCVMPDHLHFLTEGMHPTADALGFIGFFKQQTGYRFSQRNRRPLWQSKWYDHLLRSTDSPETISWYIWQNPVRAQLCDLPQNYPHLGSFTDCGSKLLQSHPPPNP
jgi:putative transposase